MQVGHRTLLKRVFPYIWMRGCHRRECTPSPCRWIFVSHLFIVQAPSEVQAKSVGEVVLSWNTELESRTVRFADCIDWIHFARRAHFPLRTMS